MNRIARGACNVGNDVALLTNECIGEAAFANVWPAYNGKVRKVFVCCGISVLVEFADNIVKQFSSTTASEGRDAERLT